MTKEIIEKLKNNKWLAYGGLSEEEKEILNVAYKDGFVDVLLLIGGWHRKDQNSRLRNASIYRIYSKYNPEPEAEEFIEFDVERLGNDLIYKPSKTGFSMVVCPDIYIKINGKEYMFEGYKFNGSEKTYSTWIRYERKNQNSHLFSYKEKDIDKVRYTNKVVYRLIP